MGSEVQERQPRNNETVIINASGERRIVPKTFLKTGFKVMNTFGWREDIPVIFTHPAVPVVAKTTTPDADPFQDITDEANVEVKPKTGPGRPKK